MTTSIEIPRDTFITLVDTWGCEPFVPAGFDQPDDPPVLGVTVRTPAGVVALIAELDFATYGRLLHDPREAAAEPDPVPPAPWPTSFPELEDEPTE